MIGLYCPGASWLHRRSARSKLLATLVLVTVMGLVPRWWVIATALVAVGAVYLTARLPIGTLWPAARPLLVLAVLLGAAQSWLKGPVRAVEIVGQLVVAVLAAHAVMLSTRVSDMVRVVSALALPLRRWGVERDRVELLLALTIGCIPRVAAAMGTAREAAAARGVRPRLVLVVPAVIIALVREADQMGEAMAARGW